LGADYSGTFESWQIFGLDFYLYPFFVEEDFVGELRVGFLLAGILLHFWKHFAGGLFGRFLGGDAYGAAGFQVDEGGRDFAPVAKFQSALAETAVGDEGDRVGDAAVDFDVGDEALAFGDGIVDAEFAEAEHCETDAEDLACAEVAVGYGGEVKILVEGLHGAIVLDGRRPGLVFLDGADEQLFGKTRLAR
jgi:hypothetical protein